MKEAHGQRGCLSISFGEFKEYKKLAGNIFIRAIDIPASLAIKFGPGLLKGYLETEYGLIDRPENLSKIRH